MSNKSNDTATINSVSTWPSISLLMPIDTKIAAVHELKQALKAATDKVKRELREHYSEEKYSPVLARMTDAIDQLGLPEGAKGVAVFSSPELAKIYFLETPVEEKIVIDDSFEMRSLLYAKSSTLNYAVLLIGSDHAKAFSVQNQHFEKIDLKVSRFEDVFKPENTKEHVTNFTDSSSVKEARLDKFLGAIDSELSGLLNKDHLAVFVLGTDRVLGHFKGITANASHIAGTVHGSYFEATVPELKILLAPYVEEWKRTQQQALVARLEAAANQHRLATGASDVWKAAQNRLGQLLVVEQNFTHPHKGDADAKKLQLQTTPGSKIFYTRDAVDEIIEHVIAYGGKVTFVDDGMLAGYDRIALIQYHA